MARNTFILTVFLAIAAAVVVGINITGRNKKIPASVPTPTPQPTIQLATGSASQKGKGLASKLSFESTACGITFTYPETHERFGETASSGVFFINKSDQNDAFYVGCSATVPRPTVLPDKIEQAKSGGGIAGTLYHDTSTKSNSPVNKFIFKHPTSGLEVIILGYGLGFDEVMSSLTLLP